MAAALSSVGCASTLYSWQESSAAARLAEAQELGAAERAPYAFYSALAHLEKARTEAAEADLGDALTLAELSEMYAEQAIEQSRAAGRGASP